MRVKGKILMTLLVEGFFCLEKIFALQAVEFHKFCSTFIACEMKWQSLYVIWAQFSFLIAAANYVYS